jgi:hypothetical protein
VSALDVRGAGSVDVRDDVRPGGVPATAEEWLGELRGPTFFRLPGLDRSRVRAVIAMLHGNEPSGLRGLHALLRTGRPPAVDLVCFVGAVEAARASPPLSHRMLPGRRDLNRCFRAPFEDADGRTARELLALLAEAAPEAVVDLHNNTGHSPAYGIGPYTDEPYLALVSLFADTYVCSRLRIGSITEAREGQAPTVTIECGRAGDPVADANAAHGLAAFANEPDALALPPGRRLRVFTDPLRVELRSGARVAFAEAPDPGGADVTLNSDVDRHNFRRLDAGERIGWVARAEPLPIRATGREGVDVAGEYFVVADGALLTRRPLVPIMMTTNAVVAAADCLFYVVHGCGL